MTIPLRLFRRLGVILVAGSAWVPNLALAVTSEVPSACSNAELARSFSQIMRVEQAPYGAVRTYHLYWDASEKAARNPTESTGESAGIGGRVRTEVGGQIQVVRCLPPGKWVVVGQGRVEGSTGELLHAAARGVDDGQPGAPQAGTLGRARRQEIQAGNLYARPMVGDFIAPLKTAVHARVNITPRVELGLAELFELESSGGKYTYDLSAQGRSLLAQQFEKFSQSSGRLVVEAYANKAGTRDALRLESQVRAQTVAQYIMRVFQLSEQQVVSIGYGSDTLPTGFVPMPRWPARPLPEKIVLRVLSR